MSDRSKKVFLLLTIVGSFMVYSVIYYTGILKNAPYKFAEFKSIVFKYGTRDSMFNTYNSATGEYQYLNNRDSLVKTHLYLSKDELLVLHRKASDLGLWDFPSTELNDDTAVHAAVKPLRYYIEFNYKRKSKKVVFETNYNGPAKLVEANVVLIKEIKKVLAEAEDREKK